MTKPIINWDGKTIPEGLKQVPPGEYALEPVPGAEGPTEDEQKGIREALQELDAGRGRTLADVVSEIRNDKTR